MNDAPLGIFDSGVGGLTVVRAVRELMPRENLIYLGDTARVPYGSKSPETIRKFAEEDVQFLLSHHVKAIVVACNTATAHALASLRTTFDLPIIGVIEAGVETALADPQATRIGVIGTRGTIRSHAYQHALAQHRTGLIIEAKSAPLLAPLIEENWLDHPATDAALKTYLDPMVGRGIDTLLLACTHYPLLIPKLQAFLPEDIRLIDSASTCAKHLKSELEHRDLVNTAHEPGTLELFLSDLSEEFDTLCERFLNHPPGRIRRAFQ